MNPSAITRTASPRAFPDNDAASSSMRPRNRRLLSTEQELVSTSGTSTPSGSRAVSPLPSKHPSRSTIRAGNSGKPVGGLLVRDNGKQRGTSPMGAGGIWEGGWTSSWTALQGLASSVLGVEVERDVGNGTKDGIGKKHTRKPSTKMPDNWGPVGLPQKNLAIGSGSLAERDAAVRARKMRGVLEGRDEDLNVQKDLNGNIKRRTSLEESRTNEQVDDDSDALVYVHHVRPQDTLAGVILRYNCQPAVFRKANRFWPNDSIQTRKVVIVPVDACTIKGRPCERPSPDLPNQGVDLLAPTPGLEEPPHFANSTWPPASSSKAGTSAERSESEDDQPWAHVRWVLIDSSPLSKPVEIARMPRKTLGYFPPRRRKSQATISTVSTPRASFEMPRTLLPNDITTSPSSTASRRTSNLGPRPSQPITGSYFPSSLPSSARPRRESVSEAADRLGWMRGPGGVGTMGKNVRKPGPAQDGFNSWAKKHIPGLAIDSLPSAAILGGESAHFGFNEDMRNIAEGSFAGGNGTTTPTGGSNSGLGLENAAAAIEGWMRRLAVKGPGTPKMSSRSGVEGADLIELLDGTGSDDGRGFEPNPGSLRSSTPSFGASGRDDLDGLARGRATAGAKGGKSD
ncbi:Uncharacterized protein D0Z07_4234 [Hyphodiscus hymeniophilus]|uniref:LysM domain-containing protein n=1 Tax=Hyphodiscus hymeniophilus TaxID=353542 RepID=A0A9P7AXB1_9HELO|nr:Uncharacterized protein D0Z07_4234 [Hyphodiscus hymeniophilus]